MPALQSNFQHSENFHSILPQFKVKFNAEMRYFQVIHFLGTPKLQTEYTPLYLTGH